VKAPAADQQRLLAVQEHDTALHQLAHRRANLPLLATLARIHEQIRDTAEEVELAKSACGAVSRELTRLEDEISKVAARRNRDQERLVSGGGMSRELQALLQDVEALDRRRDVLEEEALEVMERLEAAQGEAETLAVSLATLRDAEATSGAELKAALGQIDASQAVESAARAEAVRGLDENLVSLYERQRARRNGVGAAALLAGRCDGCGFQLSASDLAAVRKLTDDEVARCEECGGILVRGKGSGL
jgi:predicted  nucleic acid-binding Zn-ribbon protein